MRSSKRMGSGLAMILLLSAAFGMSQSEDAWWPQWRGPNGDGVARSDAPLRWSDTENVKWKVEIPGRGHSTPVVWRDRIFLTTAIPDATAPPPRPADPAPERGGEQQRQGRRGGFSLANSEAQVEQSFVVMCLNRKTGETLWRKVARVATPHEGYHRTYGSFASNAPVTDGTRVYAFFGSRGLYCYDMDGNLLWEKDFGVQMRMRLQFGEGSAPALHDDRLILNFDHEGPSFIVALDKKTGKELWRADRDEASSWSSPAVLTHGGVKQVIMTASNKVRSYDFQTGKLLWECGGLGSNTIPMPVRLQDLVLVMSGHRDPKLMAIRLGRSGDLTDSDAIVWSQTRGLSYTPSPVLHDGKLYMVTDNGMVSCLDALTGTPFYHQVRLPKTYNFKASPVAANGKLYLATEDEDVVVLKMGEEYEVLATNTLKNQVFIASPVVVQGEIFLRSQTHMFCIGE